MKCKKCGMENEEGAVFCRYCGEQLSNDEIVKSKEDPISTKSTNPLSFSGSSPINSGTNFNGIENKTQKSNLPIIVLFIVCLVLMVGIPFAILYFSNEEYSEDNTDDDIKLEKNQTYLKVESYLGYEYIKFYVPATLDMSSSSSKTYRCFSKVSDESDYISQVAIYTRCITVDEFIQNELDYYNNYMFDDDWYINNNISDVTEVTISGREYSKLVATYTYQSSTYSHNYVDTYYVVQVTDESCLVLEVEDDDTQIITDEEIEMLLDIEVI